jgi:hypothetical protein
MRRCRPARAGSDHQRDRDQQGDAQGRGAAATGHDVAPIAMASAAADTH